MCKGIVENKQESPESDREENTEKSKKVKNDGLVKSPTSALCCISQSFNVRKVRLMIAKFARLEFELFTKPSK